MEGANRLGGNIDPGLLPRIQKGLQVLVARMGDLVILSFTTIEERDWKPQVQPKVEDNYLYPSQISSHWNRLNPKSPACKGRSLWCYLKSHACKSQSLRPPRRTTPESPDWVCRDSGPAIEACTTQSKIELGWPDSLARFSGSGPKSPA
jgi:hypothetical protein